MQTMRTGAYAGLLIALLPAAQAAGPEPLYSAIRSDDVGAVQQMLKGGANVNGKDKHGATPLMNAAAAGSVKMMRALIDAGADVNARTNGEASALMWATGDIEKVRLLIESGADVNARSKYGRTPLAIAAAQAGNVEVVRLLLKKGARPGAEITDAAAANDSAIVALLLESGEDANAKNPSGLTPLMYAAGHGNTGMVKMLLARGAAVNAASGPSYGPPVRNGTIALGHLTPLMLAASAGSTETVRVLLEAGAEVNAKDVRGMTPLMLAVATDRPNQDVVRLLLKKGATPLAQSNNGESVLSWTGKYQNPGIIAAVRPAASGAEVPRVIAVSASSANQKDVAQAVEKSIALMQKSSEVFFENGGCASCHAQNMTMVAVAAARPKGIRFDEKGAEGVSRATYLQLAAFANGLMERLDPPAVEILSYAGFAMAADGVPPDRTTDALVHSLAAQQHADGSWGLPGISRPPITDGRISTTTLTIGVLRQYATPARSAEMAERVARAARWVLGEKAHSTEDLVMQLLAAKWSGQDGATIQELARKLAGRQGEDGGWAQTPYLKSDAYATGTALYALSQTDAVSTTSAVYRKGVRYLLETQAEDGSWHVVSRTPKFQPYFDGGFPYGHDQWISQMATGWASAALSAAIPNKRAMR